MFLIFFHICIPCFLYQAATTISNIIDTVSTSKIARFNSVGNADLQIDSITWTSRMFALYVYDYPVQQYRQHTTIWLKAHCLIVTYWHRQSNATATADSINLVSEFTGNSRACREEQFVKYTPRRIPNGNAWLQAYLFTDRRSKATRDLFNPMKLSFEHARVSTRSHNRSLVY